MNFNKKLPKITGEKEVIKIEYSYFLKVKIPKIMVFLYRDLNSPTIYIYIGKIPIDIIN